MANLVAFPEDFSNAQWSKSNSVINANATTAPDGTVTADRLIDNAAGGSAAILAQDAISILALTNYVYSCFVKADQVDWVQLDPVGFTGVDASIFFNAATGEFGTIEPDVNDFGVEVYPDGWFRPWLTFTNGADTTGNARILAAEADNVLNSDRDGTTSIFPWGAVFDVGTSPEIYVSEAGIVVSSGSSSPNVGLSFGKMGKMGAR